MKDINARKKIFIAISGFIIFILSLILINNLIFKEETFPHQLVITNFSDYFSEVPTKTRNKLFYYLFLFANPENEDAVSVIRENSVTKEDGFGSAIIDIDEVQKSYHVTFNLEKIEDEEHDLNFSCLKKSERIYKSDTSCLITNNEATFIATIEHSYLISGIIHSREADLVMRSIEEFATSINELLSSPSDETNFDNVQINILESSYRSYQTYPNIIYSLSAVVDDGRTYDIYINTNNKSNVATYITRTDITGHSTATIYSSETDRTELENWIRSLSSDVEITYEEF